MKTGISVCIPARNSAWCLPDCLKSLENQSIKPNEIVICVGPSRDETERIVRSFKKRSKIPTKIVYDEKGLRTGYARKTLVDNSETETILWIDSDCVAPPNWIEMHLKAIQNHDYDVISGPQVVVSEGFIQSMRKEKGELDTEKIRTQKKSVRAYPINIISNGNCSMKKDIILKAGNYDPLFSRGQDWDITIRLRAINAKMAWNNELACLHRAQKNRYARSLKDGTFLKFLYKYGFRYVSYNPIHFAAFSLRVFLLFSIFLIALSTIYAKIFLPSLLLLLFSASSLIYGTWKKRGLNIQSLIVELCKCVGEFLTIFEILGFKDKKGPGYGKFSLPVTRRIRNLNRSEDKDV